MTAIRLWRAIFVLAAICAFALSVGNGAGAASPRASGGAASSSSRQQIPAEPRAPAFGEIKASTTTDQTVNMPPTRLDTNALRLGNYDYTTSPRKGYIDLCHPPGAGNPVTTPPWVDTANGTWSADRKVAVEGDVRWHSRFSVKRAGSRLQLAGNGLPPRSGVFPVASSDPAHAYNPDPEAIKEHSIKVSLPYEPRLAGGPGCVNGIVGMVANGIPLLDGFDAGGRDAGAEETQDTCHGHPNPQAGYHYHSLSPCLLTAESLHKTTQVGWAFDGFGIYVEYDKHGDLLTNASLDACHGRTSVVPWHGREVRMYHYDMTYEFPYSVGCFRGTPVPASRVQGLGYMGS